MKNIKLIYILPNLFTALSVFFGMMSIIASSQEKFEKAFIYIILSFIADGLDGRVARLTNTSSKFGLEFDSLADIVAFGVAPAMMLFFSIGENYGKFGALITGLFVVFGAIRLARFNVTTLNNDPSVFIGLPIPTAAAVLASLIMLNLEINHILNLVILLFAFLLSILMVSNIRFPSFKKINLEQNAKLKVLIIIIMLASLLYLYPIFTLAITLSGYIAYGVIRWIWSLKKAIKK
ncbi:MAG: CDP-diacylglycerol--serine O-phosphatidyltransferase [Nautilia sp.]|nr:MAG: CDP-diacylglycerol--serine O-phosphatidyltransferase [Nautilia sp.]